MSSYPDMGGGQPANVATGVAPPHSVEAEQSVLGGILLSDRAMYGLVIEEGLKPDDFYRDRHAKIYEAMLSLYQDSEPIDVLTVAEYLRSKGELDDIGGRAAIDELTGGVPGLGGIRRYAQIVRDHALMRRLLKTTYEIQASVINHEAPPRELIEHAERSMLEVAHDDRQKDFRSIDEILGDELTKMEMLSREGTSLTGTPSGFGDLDDITGGFQPGNLIILAARPSMGKCIGGDALIHDPHSGVRRRLDDVVRRFEAGEDCWVSAAGADGRIRPARVSHARRSGLQELFEVRTRLGRRTRATANHPLLTREGWVAVDALTLGCEIAIPRPLALPSRLATALVSVGGTSIASKPALPMTPRTSDIWFDEIVSIEPSGWDETYDLEVPVHHNFVADGIVVHNSALVTNIAENAAIDFGKAVALFSLEMSETELAQRFVASQARIKGDELRKGKVADRKWPKIVEASGRLASAPLFIDDSADVGLLEIRAKARRLHQQHGGLGLIIVDYLQLMRPDTRIESRVLQVGEMSRGLKMLARELATPVIALSQLSRAVETRGTSVESKRPLLSDLRECVTGDTLVTLANGCRTPIRDLVGTQPRVMSVNEQDQLVPAEADLVWSVGRKPVFDLQLASGRTIRATAEHRMRSGAGWSTVGELVPGDRVALARELPEPTDPLEWPEDRLVLLGHLVGDGSYLTHQPLRYTTADEENSRVVREAAEREFGATVNRHEGRGAWHQLVISGNGTRWAPAGVNLWLRELGLWNQRSAEKCLPPEVFALGDAQIGLLLRHLWATDGCVWSKVGANGRLGVRVYFATASERLARDVSALLLRLGIVARIKATPQPSGSDMWTVDVSGAAAQLRFLDRVGAFGPRVAPADELRRHLAERTPGTNVDTLPLQTWDRVREVMADRGITQRGMAEMRGTSYGGTSHFRFAPARATIADYATLLEDAELAAAARSDLFWDRVVSVEPAGEDEVFDLTVPDTACWLADGIVTHNSGSIEQDADLVAFIFREEYYDSETERQGIADIIIAKHRNGGLGDVQLTFAKEYPKFMSYTPPDRYE